MSDLDELRRELTEGLWWLNFIKLWENVARAYEAKCGLDAAMWRYNELKKQFRVKGRPKGAKNKAKPEPVLEDVIDSL